MKEVINGHELEIQDTGAPRGERNYWYVNLNGVEQYAGYNRRKAEDVHGLLERSLRARQVQRLQGRLDQLESLIAQGWLLVPPEPTLDMVDAGMSVDVAQYESHFDEVWSIYQAMLAAVPQGAAQADRVPVSREYMERLIKILDAHNYAREAEALMAMVAAAPQGAAK